MKKIFLIIGLTLFLIPQAQASVHRDVKEGNKLYKSGQYEKSADRYNAALIKEPNNDIINYNMGSALYKNGNYEQAISNYMKALLSDEDNIKKNAYYNLGNSFFKAGMKQEKKDIQKAIGALENSLKQYHKALAMDDKDKDAKYNYEIVKKELERLRKKQKQQQKQQQQQKKQQQKKQNKQNKQNQQNQQNKDNQQNQQQKQNQQQNKNKQQQQQNQNQQQHNQQNQKQQNQNQNQNQNQKNKQQPQNQQIQPGQQLKPGEISKEEARMLINNYQQNEEKNLLDLNIKKSKPREVEKDW